MTNVRLRRALLCLIIIASGLGLRRYGYEVGLTFPVVKYGGSILWGAMVFFLVGLALPSRSIIAITVTAFGIGVTVECSRLLHTPELDLFRLTLAGKLLLGRVFSLWNIVAYAAGILFAHSIEIAVLKARTIL